jgi:hypothetical protein
MTKLWQPAIASQLRLLAAKAEKELTRGKPEALVSGLRGIADHIEKMLRRGGASTPQLADTLPEPSTLPEQPVDEPPKPKKRKHEKRKKGTFTHPPWLPWVAGYGGHQRQGSAVGCSTAGIREFEFGRYQQRYVAFEVMYIGWKYRGFAGQSNTDNTVEVGAATTRTTAAPAILARPLPRVAVLGHQHQPQ